MKLTLLIPGSMLWIPERIQASYCSISLIEYENKKIIIEPSFIPAMRFLEEKFHELNLLPEDITDIFLTHFHLDHAYNSIFFKNAKIHVYNNFDHKDFAKFGPFNGKAYNYIYNEIKNRVVKFKDKDILFNKIKIIHTPYHSRDHVSFFIETKNYGNVFFPGDICMTRIDYFDMIRDLRNDNAALILNKYSKLSDWIFFTHDSPYKIKGGSK